jgi:hypothetical protein
MDMPQKLEMVLGHGELGDGSPADRLDVRPRIGHQRSSGQVQL